MSIQAIREQLEVRGEEELAAAVEEIIAVAVKHTTKSKNPKVTTGPAINTVGAMQQHVNKVLGTHHDIKVERLAKNDFVVMSPPYPWKGGFYINSHDKAKIHKLYESLKNNPHFTTKQSSWHQMHMLHIRRK